MKKCTKHGTPMKLKELVSKGIEGGWGHECDYESGDPYRVRWETYGDGSASIEVIRDYSDDYVHVPDLINDDDFMALIYGKRTVCPVCGAKEGLTPSTRPDVWWCKDSCPGSVKLINRYKYIQQQAITLSGDAQVKYLHKMMKEGE